MAIPIPSKEPTEFVGGATVKWTKVLGDYPASSWTLTYSIRALDAAGGSLEVTATADGDTHVVTISATDSGTLAAGTYEWQAKVTSGSEVAYPDTGMFEVKASLDIEPAGVDRRHWARIALERIQNVLKGRASRSDLSYTVPGVGMTVSQMTPEQLWLHHDRLAAIVAGLDAEDAINNGDTQSTQVYATFTRPS